MFGVGYLPVAPGTWGSLAALLLWYALPMPENQILFLFLTIFVILIGIYTSAVTERQAGGKDPSIVVVDEWAGQWIALLFLERSIIFGIMSFILFRILDIWKPGPVKWADKKAGGLGIMGDDILAGLISFIILQGILLWI